MHTFGVTQTSLIRFRQSSHQGTSSNFGQLPAEEWLTVRDGTGMLRTRKMGDLGDWIEERFLDGREPPGDIQVVQLQSLCQQDKKSRKIEAEDLRPWMLLEKSFKSFSSSNHTHTVIDCQVSIV